MDYNLDQYIKKGEISIVTNILDTASHTDFESSENSGFIDFIDNLLTLCTNLDTRTHKPAYNVKNLAFYASRPIIVIGRHKILINLPRPLAYPSAQ